MNDFYGYLTRARRDLSPCSFYQDRPEQFLSFWSQSADRGKSSLVLRRIASRAFKEYLRATIEHQKSSFRFLFMLGTVRSGSSVLSEILCDNPEIIGNGERHIAYTEPECFVELACRLLHERRMFRVPQAFMFDKILHNELIPDVREVSRMPITWIVLHRDPLRCIASAMQTFGVNSSYAIDHFDWRWSRLRRDISILRDAGARVISLQYEELVESPSDILGQLSDQLSLSTPLGTSYSSRNLRVSGGASRDPGPNLKAGKIIVTQRPEISLAEHQHKRLDKVAVANREVLQSSTVCLGKQ